VAGSTPGPQGSDPLARIPLSQIRDLPTLPSIAARAIAVAEDAEATADDLLDLIQTDPGIAARVVRVANSVFYNRGYQIKDLRSAVVRLGLWNIRNILLGVSMVRTFDSFFAGAPYSREDFWTHCVAVGSLAGRLTESRNLSSSVAFLAGLLHDLGKLLLDRYLQREFREAVGVARREGLALPEAEERGLGLSHATVGAGLLEVWKLPAEIVEPVRHHHDPERCPQVHRPQAVLLQVADYLVNLNGVGFSGNAHPARPSEEYFGAFNLSGEMIRFLIDSIRRESLPSVFLPA
jgi:putative nucleotidyltransferase with HDIG domain